MNESENKNRDTRIKQQKQLFWKRTFILIAVVLVITVLFVVMKNKAAGTKIDVPTFEAELNAGHIKEIYFEKEKALIKKEITFRKIDLLSIFLYCHICFCTLLYSS